MNVVINFITYTKIDRNCYKHIIILLQLCSGDLGDWGTGNLVSWENAIRILIYPIWEDLFLFFWRYDRFT